MLSRRPLAAAVALALIAPATALTSSSTASATPTVAAAPTASKLAAKRLPRPAKAAHDRAFDPDTVLVKFKPSASKAKRDRALAARGGRIGARVDGTDFVEVHAKGRADKLARDLSVDPAVAEVTLDFVRESSATPNDPGLAYGDQEYLKTVRMPAAWDRSKGSLSQVVAVVDTGVNGQHPDLTGRTVAGWNALTNSSIAAGAMSDDNGHGTMVSGIIAAETNNGDGIAGVAWNARVMPIKVLDGNGNGTDSDVVEGINWAVSHGAKIINLSLGGDADSPLLHDAVKNAVAKGAVVVVASGNWGDDVPQYPAAYPEAIAVGATDTSAALTDFSSWGPWIDVAAPGFGILSTGPGVDYYIGDGTSFSAPIVSGVVALLRTQTPSLTPAQVLSRLRSTARDAGPRGIDPYYGAGVLDAANALGAGWAADFAQPSLGANEPNDVPARATTLGGTIDASIGAEGDVDWYRYTSVEERGVAVTVTPPANDPNNPQNLDPVVAIYDKDLKLIGELDAKGPGVAETMSLRLAPTDYYVTVRNFNGARLPSSAYTLTVTDNPVSGYFDPAVSTSVGSWPATVSVGDVTGDGRKDVLMTTSYYFDEANDYKVFLYAQQPDGSLAAPKRLTPADAAPPYNALPYDVDGDGRLDVLAPTSSGVQAFLQQSDGTLAAPATVAALGAADTVVPADMDGDGDLDLVVRGASGTQVMAHEADGSFTPSPVTADPMGGEIEVGDVDGDSRPDVVVLESGTVRVYHHAVDGWTRTDHPVNSIWSVSGLEVVDATGDGLADVVYTVSGNRPNSFVGVMAQTPEHTLAPAVLHAVPDIPEPIDAADVDGNGTPDLVTAHGGWNTLSVLPLGTDGVLGDPVTASVPYASHYSVNGLALGDVTGDGRTDAVLADYNNGLVLLRHAAGVTEGSTQQWVRSTTPSDFGSGMTLTYTPTVTFARDVVPSSVTTSTVRILNGRTGAAVPATVTYDATRRTATVKPTTALYDYAPYRLVVSGVKDTSDETMTTAYSSTFRTADYAPPAVGSFKATGALRAATLTWTAPHVNDLDRYIVRMATGSTPPSSPTTGTAVYSGTGLSATVSLAQGTTYSFRIWAKDRTGHYSAAPSLRLVGTAETISSNVTSVRKGYSVTLSSKLVRKDTGGPIAGVPVQLYWRKVGTTTWYLTATRTSSSTGTVSYAHAPTASVDYMWVYRGSTSFVGSSSALRRVTVS